MRPTRALLGMTLAQDRRARILRFAPRAVSWFGQSATLGTVFKNPLLKSALRVASQLPSVSMAPNLYCRRKRGVGQIESKPLQKLRLLLFCLHGLLELDGQRTVPSAPGAGFGHFDRPAFGAKKPGVAADGKNPRPALRRACLAGCPFGFFAGHRRARKCGTNSGQIRISGGDGLV